MPSAEAAALLERYLPVGLFLLIALVFPVQTFLATRLLRPSRPSPLKDMTYECGEEPEGEAMIRFHFQYYMFAIIFVAFDVAAIFLLLFALDAGALLSGPGSGLAVLSVVLFIAILFVTTSYALHKEEVIRI
jgi:NADH:ubiquinone oxidoreductase subunit 3 (subunit A)